MARQLEAHMVDKIRQVGSKRETRDTSVDGETSREVSRTEGSPPCQGNSKEAEQCKPRDKLKIARLKDLTLKK